LSRYENGSKLTGIIYLLRISDEGFTGIPRRNFKAFRELCGDSILKNTVIVTNMWGKVAWEVGEAHEKELITNYFKSSLDEGAQLARHHNTTQCAHDIIRCIMKNRSIAPQIRREHFLTLPPARPSAGNSDTWYDGLHDIAPPTPFPIPSRFEQVAENRMASPEFLPSSRPGYSPQSVLSCAAEVITDTGGPTFVSSLPAYSHPTVDRSNPEGPLSTATLPHPVAIESQAVTFPPNWRKIPQKAYDHGRRQWDFTPSEPILFSVNGRPGVNMGDAFREGFQGLEGWDDLVLQDAGSTVSCRLLVRLS